MTFDPTIGVLALVPDHWDGVTYGRHQILTRLAKRFNVLWLEPASGWRDFIDRGNPAFLRRDRVFSPCENLQVLVPGMRHPLMYSPRPLADITLRSRLAVARARLRAAGAKRIVLYIWRDEYLRALDQADFDVSCYHIDDEYSFDESDPPNSATEMELLARADQVIIHSEQLLKKKGGVNPHTVLIPNGVDYASFAGPRAAPADLLAIPAPRIGYAGVIKWQLDFELLHRLASARPQCSFVMVGPVRTITGKEQQVAALQQLPNVHFLGSRPADQLGAYVQHFDVCLMCYEVNNYTKYIYPLKLHEYLAGGQPTVSAPLDAVLEFEGSVTLARSDAEWLAAIDAGLQAAARTPAAVAARRAVAQAYDWDVITERVATTFRETLARK